MIVLDTSLLVDSLAGPRRSAANLRRAVELGERIQIPALVLYEWRRGPRIPEELDAQETLFPSAEAIPFGVEEAAAAADLYRALENPRGREVDIAIAACAITHEADLWTLNRTDFAALPGLSLYTNAA